MSSRQTYADLQKSYRQHQIKARRQYRIKKALSWLVLWPVFLWLASTLGRACRWFCISNGIHPQQIPTPNRQQRRRNAAMQRKARKAPQKHRY